MQFLLILAFLSAYLGTGYLTAMLSKRLSDHMVPPCDTPSAEQLGATILLWPFVWFIGMLLACVWLFEKFMLGVEAMGRLVK